MAKKGQTFLHYPIELKMQAIRLVVDENMSLREVAKELGIRNKTQVLNWVKNYKSGMDFESQGLRKGRPKAKFASMEEEMAYLRAENEYLKKLYPNLHGEASAKQTGSKSSKNFGKQTR